MALSKVMVMDANSAIQSSDELEFLYRSIFQIDQLDELHQQLFGLLTQQPQLWASHARLVNGLKDILTANLQQNPDHSRLRALLAEVLSHETRAFDNAVAYNPGLVENPLAVWWPDPTSNQTWTGNPRSIHQELPFARRLPFIDKDTPIGSAGSCFAQEIYRRLSSAGFNYVQTEPNIHSSAKWGVIFNIPSFRLLIQKSFGQIELPRLLWRKESDKGVEYRDPFREEVAFESVEAYEAEYDNHIRAAREALTKVKVFIMTLGLNEIWSLRSDPRIVFSRNPWNFSPYLTERRTLSVEESLRELQTMLDIWRSFNPDLKLILSVSPVPLMATFQAKDMHVISATCHAKSLLRVVAHEFAARNKDVFYFPSFETVMYCTDNPWDADQRHVAPHAVDNVMRLFDKMFVKDGYSVSAAATNSISSESLADGEAMPGPCLLAALSPEQREPAKALIQAYVEAFTQGQCVSLMLWIDPSTGLAEEAAYGWIDELLQELGIESDRLPDLALYLEPLSQLRAMLPSLSAVIVTGQPADAPLLQWCKTEAPTLPLIQPDSGSLYLAWQKAREIEEMNEICADLRVQGQSYSPAQSKIFLHNLALMQDGFKRYVQAGEWRGYFNQEVFEAMRLVTLASQGRLKRQIEQRFAKIYPPVALTQDNPDGDKGLLSGIEHERVLAEVERDGYSLLGPILSPESCEELYNFAREVEADPMPELAGRRLIYHPDQPEATTYWIPEATILTHPTVQKILADPSLLDFAQRRMGCEPILNRVCLWWSTPFGSEETQSSSAQMFHVDMDEMSFFHLFFYITDVTDDNGPHCYVRGSYREKPPELWCEGRLKDEEVLKFYSADDIICLTGPRGTSFAAETHSLHKGLPVKRGERLAFQCVFAQSLFGGKNQAVKIPADSVTPEFAAAVKKFPRYYQLYDITGA